MSLLDKLKGDPLDPNILNKDLIQLGEYTDSEILAFALSKSRMEARKDPRHVSVVDRMRYNLQVYGQGRGRWTGEAIKEILIARVKITDTQTKKTEFEDVGGD